MEQMTAKELENKMNAGEKVNIVDVRTAEEVAEGKMLGAKHIPFGEILERLNEFDKDEHYYMVCASGNRSGIAAKQLRAKGYTATNISDGMIGWQGDIE